MFPVRLNGFTLDIERPPRYHSQRSVEDTDLFEADRTEERHIIANLGRPPNAPPELSTGEEISVRPRALGAPQARSHVPACPPTPPLQRRRIRQELSPHRLALLPGCVFALALQHTHGSTAALGVLVCLRAHPLICPLLSAKSFWNTTSTCHDRCGSAHAKPSSLIGIRGRTRWRVSSIRAHAHALGPAGPATASSSPTLGPPASLS
jgi:hypothetical protein